ncbi:glutamate racemase [Bacillus coahuilensis p1.1.43]|uniref:Glutamate racemase n=1 Tax=Bacillus coahuilensis p1.1.43 TaxID=1150625 RepID=A0A147K772_9BACI|nr:glutamate racemase [Bacillus coahuilensis]KUP05908.1 glutamate racemase [Bacillus coahuilensis p1.1.43]
MNKPIGIIDSGVGGLTVVKEVMRQLPNERIYYVGDTARCPYGPRHTDEVRTFTWELTNYLLQYDIKMLIIACNTATAVVLDEIKHKLSIPVIGVIDPGARAAIKHTKSGRIGVLGTNVTVKSKAYDRALRTINRDVQVWSKSCPKFVPLVESGEYTGPFAEKIVKNTLQSMKQHPLDTIILGCTHYPLLEPIIQDVMGSNVKVISSGDETAREASAILDYQELIYAGETKPAHRFFTTGSVELFKNIAESWLELEAVDVEKIVL